MTATPPPTSLSEPASPTEIDGSDTLGADNMSKTAAKRPIYLIVATALSPPLGIGLGGTLPWGQISKDMTYFRNMTTKGVPQHAISASTDRNAVIMGRKTWQSIPPKFRPLAGRTNVILTRSNDGMSRLSSEVAHELRSKANASEEGLRSSVDVVNKEQSIELTLSNSSDPAVIVTSSIQEASKVDARQVYCIGGAEIYNLFLRDPTLRPHLRVLQTEIQKKDGTAFECDTFWPESCKTAGWTEASKDEIQSWTGIEVPQKQQDWVADEKAGVLVRVRGWQQTQ